MADKVNEILKKNLKEQRNGFQRTENYRNIQ